VIILKSSLEIERMKGPCKIVSETLELLRQKIQPGITTLDLDQFAELHARKCNAVPAFKGYSGYPFSLCCSVNSQVVHGFPTSKELKNGDILSIDFGVVFDGFYGDAAITVAVGSVAVNASALMKITEEALYKGIEKAAVNNNLSDISAAVQIHAEKNGFSVVREFVGHGIGRSLHESPQVPNFGKPGRGVKLKQGMVLAIEPMINEKGPEVRVLSDGWTAVTVDGGLSAHFEHTVAITANGPEILTKL
jgi:methionyl aminopeptidase